MINRCSHNGGCEVCSYTCQFPSLHMYMSARPSHLNSRATSLMPLPNATPTQQGASLCP